MLAWFALILAAAGTIVCLFLGFREARRVMRDRKSMVAVPQVNSRFRGKGPRESGATRGGSRSGAQ